MIDSKLASLRESLSALSGAVIAFSGGADSAFLAEISHQELGENSLAVTADSPSMPRRELKDAVALARSRGWLHTVVETEEMNVEDYVSNPRSRCYFCKVSLFDRLSPLASRLSQPILLGTNLDDLGDFRPGLAAAKERNALHPLVDAGFSKEELRLASKQIGLPTFDKPAAACLSSRFAYGVRITVDGLARVEAAEEYLLERGFSHVRVRDLGDDRAKLEVDPAQVAELQQEFEAIGQAIRELGFHQVALDPLGYRQGSLNVTIGGPHG